MTDSERTELFQKILSITRLHGDIYSKPTCKDYNNYFFVLLVNSMF